VYAAVIRTLRRATKHGRGIIVVVPRFIAA